MKFRSDFKLYVPLFILFIKTNVVQYEQSITFQINFSEWRGYTNFKRGPTLRLRL